MALEEASEQADQVNEIAEENAAMTITFYYKLAIAIIINR